MSFEAIRNATRESVGEADSLDGAIDLALAAMGPGRHGEVVVREPGGALVATVWHDGMVER